MIKNSFELFQYSDTNLLMASEYNPLLVVLSISIAIFASYMGLQVASQAARASFVRKHVYLFIGSLALGCGIWSMHFIGMLALELCTAVSYQFDLTIISIIPAVAASWVALNLITRGNLKYIQLIIGGILVGVGIGAMHYIGMAAMEMTPLLRYDLSIFVVSILVAIILAILSLWVRFGLDDIGKIQLSRKWKIIISSCVMGIAISGMHYIGMAAARFVLPPGFETSTQTDDISLYLAVGITLVTIFVISVVLAVNLIFRYKNISAKALQNERRLSAIMETAVDGIITINAKGIIISVNKMVTILLGWESEELLGNNVKMIVPVPFQHDHDQYIENYLKTGVAKIIGTGREVEAMTKSGEKIPMRLGIGHVKVNNQHMFVAFISDLRDRIKMETTLRENETRIRSLLTNIPGIAYRCIDVPGWPNLFINDEVEKITGYPAQDFLLPDPKRSLGDFVHPDDFSIIEATDLRHPDGYQIEFRLIDRYNTVKWMLGYGRATKVENSKNYYLDGFIMDISDRKKMESEMVTAKEKAEKAAETRAAFLANMSHEIRTPMNAIIGFSDILLHSELDHKQHKYLNTINQSAKSLLHILNDLLDSAKLEKGKFQLEYRDFSLVEEVDAVVSTLWLEAQNKGLEISLNIPPKVQGYYNGAPDRIRQVLTNLLGNAIKFTQQGTIEIRIEMLADQTIQFVIKDTGIGMTPSQLETIFDAFAQADESMSRRFGGTGLGTTISKQLVELMGGNITATSIEGEGSEFSFTLPLKAIESIDNGTEQYSSQALPPLNVLVVDDIDQNIELLSLILKRHGHTVFEARDGEQALVQMENNRIDIVLMDIQMPVMDGLTAAKFRRTFEANNNCNRIPIIALTASVLPQDRLSAEQAGMDGFANKPINIRELFNEIASVLKLQNVTIDANDVMDKSTLKIDVDSGITLWGSKTNFYAELGRFIKHAESELCTLNDSLTDNDWQTLEQLAHKYKGSVGNLALNRLMKMFELLEQSTQKRDREHSQQNIANIEAEFHIIKDCVINMSDGLNDVAQSEPSISDDSILSLLDTLRQLKHCVQNNEFNDALLDKLQALNSVSPKEINEIINACNDFEFSYAADLVNVLISKLEQIMEKTMEKMQDNKQLVLVVDDEPANLRVLNQLLNDTYKLVFAKSGQEALRLVEKELPNLILLDVMMPEMTGYEVCAQLKKNTKFKSIPIIFVTALSDPNDEAKGLNLGAVDYISKPISPAVVKARVKTHLSLVDVDELKKSRLEVIQRLGRASEYKDNETGMHVMRMSHYSKVIAEAYGFSKVDANNLFSAAPMHDIGKIGIPDSIMLKPGKLTEEEFSIMKKHPEIGAEILGESDSGLIALAKVVSLTHHEKWDGTGYPNQLEGNNIPIEGRIVALADVFDALTSVRPYKDEWPVEKAMDFIRSQKGKHFDPELVDCLDQQLEKILEIKEQWKD